MVFNIQRDMDDNDSAGETLKREAKEFFGYFKRGQGVCAYHYVNLPDTKGSVEPEEEDTPHFDVRKLEELNIKYDVTQIIADFKFYDTFDLSSNLVKFKDYAYEYYETTEGDKTKRLRYAIPKTEDYQQKNLQFLRPRGANTGFDRYLQEEDKSECGVWLPSFRQGKGTSYTSRSIYMYDPLMEMVERVLKVAGEIKDSDDNSLKNIDSDGQYKASSPPYDLTPVSLLPSIDVLSDALGGLVEWTWYLCEIVITLEKVEKASAPVSVFSRTEKVQVVELITQAMWVMVMKFAFRERFTTPGTESSGVAVSTSKQWFMDLLKNMDKKQEELVMRIHSSVYNLEGQTSEILFDEKSQMYGDIKKLNGEKAPYGICARLRQAVKYAGDALMASVSREFLTKTWKPKPDHTNGMTLNPKEPLIPEVDALYREARTYAWTFPDACDYHASDKYNGVRRNATTTRGVAERQWYHFDTVTPTSESSSGSEKPGLRVPGKQSIPTNTDKDNEIDYELPYRMEQMKDFNANATYDKTFNDVNKDITGDPALAQSLWETIEPGLSPLDRTYIYEKGFDKPWMPGKRLVIVLNRGSETKTYYLPSHYKVNVKADDGVPSYKYGSTLEFSMYNFDRSTELKTKINNLNIVIDYPKTGVSQEISLDGFEALESKKTNKIINNLIYMPPRRPIFGESMYNFSLLAWMRSMVSMSNHKIISKRMELNQTISDVKTPIGFEKLLNFPEGGSPTALNSNSIFIILLFKWFVRNGITSDIAISSKDNGGADVIVNIENNGWHTYYPETWCKENGEKEDTPISAIDILMNDYKTEFVRMVLDRMIYHDGGRYDIHTEDHGEFYQYKTNKDRITHIDLDTPYLNQLCKKYDRNTFVCQSRLRQSMFQLKRSGSSLFFDEEIKVRKDTRDNSIFPKIQTKPNASDILRRPLCEFLSAETLSDRTTIEQLNVLFHRLVFYCANKFIQKPIERPTLDDFDAEQRFQIQNEEYNKTTEAVKTSLTGKKILWQTLIDEDMVSKIQKEESGFDENRKHLTFTTTGASVPIFSVFGRFQETVDDDTLTWPRMERVEEVSLYTTLSEKHYDVFNYILFNYGNPNGFSLLDVIKEPWDTVISGNVEKIHSDDAAKELIKLQEKDEAARKQSIINTIDAYIENVYQCHFYIAQSTHQDKLTSMLSQVITMFEESIPLPPKGTDASPSGDALAIYDAAHFPFCDIVNALVYSLADATVMYTYAMIIHDFLVKYRETENTNHLEETKERLRNKFNAFSQGGSLSFEKVESVGFRFVEHKFGLERSDTDTDMRSIFETGHLQPSKNELTLTACLNIFKTHFEEVKKLLYQIIERKPETYRRFLKDVEYRKRHPSSSDVPTEDLYTMRSDDLRTAVENKFINPRKLFEIETAAYRRKRREEEESERQFKLDSEGNVLTQYEVERKVQVLNNNKILELLEDRANDTTKRSDPAASSSDTFKQPIPDSALSDTYHLSSEEEKLVEQMEETNYLGLYLGASTRDRKRPVAENAPQSTAPPPRPPPDRQPAPPLRPPPAPAPRRFPEVQPVPVPRRKRRMSHQQSHQERLRGIKLQVVGKASRGGGPSSELSIPDARPGRHPELSFRGQGASASDDEYYYYYNETSACVGASDDRVEGRLQRMVLDLPSAEHIERTTAMITKLLKEHLVM